MDDPRRGAILLKRCYQWGTRDPDKFTALAEEVLAVTSDPAVAVWARFALTQRQQLTSQSWIALVESVKTEQERLLNDPSYQRFEAGMFGGTAGYPRMVLVQAEALALTPRQF